MLKVQIANTDDKNLKKKYAKLLAQHQDELEKVKKQLKYYNNKLDYEIKRTNMNYIKQVCIPSYLLK